MSTKFSATCPRCGHGEINAGNNQSWCDGCGVIVWESDGLSVGVPGADERDRADWCQRNVTAYGCGRESRGDKKCEHWCGSGACPKTLMKDAA